MCEKKKQIVGWKMNMNVANIISLNLFRDASYMNVREAMDGIVTFMLNNLTIVIGQQSSLLGGLKIDLQSIKDELEQMQAFLKRAEFLVENDSGLKAWVGLVRDVVYDIEDILDEFMLRCTRRHSKGLFCQVRKIKTKIITLRARHKIASEINKIKNRIANISEAHKRYQAQYGGAAESTGSSSYTMHNTLHDRRGDALLLEESNLVGIEESKIELKGKLLSDDVRRIVISVVCMGGLGKTTLVKKVYDDASVSSHFTHLMWITVSESFKLEELLKATIRRVFKEQKRHISRVELDDLDLDGVKQLTLESLQSKKYLVVFDDVWSQTDWDAIHLAFPRNKCGSRVLITTRKLDLSEAASNVEDGGFVYPLKPLREEEARLLFCKTTFGDSRPCPNHLTRACQSILGACEGLPLAIVVFCRSLGDVCESNKKMNVMMKLLSLSYYDLPNHLRIKSIRVHDIVRLIILLKANEQNIATIINSKRLHFLPNKTRRLTIHGTFDKINELECTCKSLRSLVLHDSRSRISKTYLQNLLYNGRRLVKVLDLRNASFTEIPSEIFTLVHLKYFSLRNTKVTSIPKSIGKLRNLETLDLKQTYIT